MITHKSLFFILLQSAEEIERLTVDEQLSDIERAVYLLRYVETLYHYLPLILTLRPRKKEILFYGQEDLPSRVGRSGQLLFFFKLGGFA